MGVEINIIETIEVVSAAMDDGGIVGKVHGNLFLMHFESVVTKLAD